MSSHSRLLPRIGATVAGVLGVLAITAAPAAAQTPCYPPGPNCIPTNTPIRASITVSDRTVVRGQSIIVTVTGFRGGSVIRIQIRSHPQDLATVSADGQGRASVNVIIPVDMELGDHTIAATGVSATGQPLDLTTGITVVEAVAAVAPINRVVPANLSAATPSARNPSASTSKGGTALAKTGAAFALPAAAVGFALVGTGLVLTRTVKKRKTAAA